MSKRKKKKKKTASMKPAENLEEKTKGKPEQKEEAKPVVVGFFELLRGQVEVVAKWVADQGGEWSPGQEMPDIITKPALEWMESHPKEFRAMIDACMAPQEPVEEEQPPEPKLEPKPPAEEEVKEPTYCKELRPISKDIAQDDIGRKTLFGQASRLRIASGGWDVPEIILGKKKSVAHKLSAVAWSQLNAHIGVPVAFTSKLPPGLRTDIYNWLFSAVPEEAGWWQILTKGHYIRGFVFENKARFTNADVVEMFAEELPENSLLDGYDLQEHELQFRAIFADKPICFLDGKKQKGLFAGFHVTHSEFASHGLKVDFVIWREAGPIGLLPLVRKRRYYRARQVYIPKDIVRDKPAIQKHIEAGLENCRKEIRGLLAKLDEPVGECRSKIEKARKKEMNAKQFVMWAEKVRKKYKFPKEVQERAEKRFEDEEGTHFGAVSSFAHVAAKVKDAGKRYELECLTGLFLDMA